jgi:hypothetical protein
MNPLEVELHDGNGVCLSVWGGEGEATGTVGSEVLGHVIFGKDSLIRRSRAWNTRFFAECIDPQPSNLPETPQLRLIPHTYRK